MNKAIKQNVLDKAKNKRADFLKNGSILWQGQKDLNSRHAVLERKARFQLSRVLKYSPPKIPHKTALSGFESAVRFCLYNFC